MINIYEKIKIKGMEILLTELSRKYNFKGNPAILRYGSAVLPKDHYFFFDEKKHKVRVMKCPF